MSAYGTWVSEVMLQQTRVETVVDYFVKWMTLFPNPKALAEADLEQVPPRHLLSSLHHAMLQQPLPVLFFFQFVSGESSCMITVPQRDSTVNVYASFPLFPT